MRTLIALLIMLCSSNAAALSCFVPPLEERYRDHSHVALVEVTGARVEESDGFSTRDPFETVDSIVITVDRERQEPKWRRIVATVRVRESFKGQSPPTELVLTSWGHNPEVTVGAMYLVFLNGPDVALDCDGMPMVSVGDPEDARVVGELRALKEPRPN